MRRYGFGTWTLALNDMPESLEQVLPPSDARRRRDVRLLEEGRYVEADAERVRILKRVSAARALATRPHQPRWFRVNTEVHITFSRAAKPLDVLQLDVEARSGTGRYAVHCRCSTRCTISLAGLCSQALQTKRLLTGGGGPREALRVRGRLLGSAGGSGGRARPLDRLSQHVCRQHGWGGSIQMKLSCVAWSG